jgi:hypothetical protein
MRPYSGYMTKQQRKVVAGWIRGWKRYYWVERNADANVCRIWCGARFTGRCAAYWEGKMYAAKMVANLKP